MSKSNLNVLVSGAVCLGPHLVCDGYADHARYRVQTHIHQDHMGGFNRSKGVQDIYLTDETFKLLVAEQNADLPFRENFIRVKRNIPQHLEDGSQLTLVSANHMLGSCQVLLELPRGLRIGYSGDFGWPIEDVIQVDQLVIDSTYGNPNSIRGYTQDQAEQCLLETVTERLRHGSVHVKAHPGTIERVLHILSGNINVPMVATERLLAQIEIYQQHGFGVGEVHSIDSGAGREAVNQRSYVRLYSRGESFQNELIEGSTISCSAYMVDYDYPLKTYSERAYQVALSNHADFRQTLEYIQATGAKYVVTDNTRNYGVVLAMAINSSLEGVTAVPSSNQEVFL